MHHDAVGTEQLATVQTFRLGILLTSGQRFADVALRKPARHTLHIQYIDTQGRIKILWCPKHLTAGSGSEPRPKNGFGVF